MKKIVSNLLYVLFFGFALMLVIACILLIVNISGDGEKSYHDIEAVQISEGGEDEAEYNRIRSQEKTMLERKSLSSAYLDKGYKALDDEKKEYLYRQLSDSVYSISEATDQNNRYRLSRIRVKDKKLSEFDIREVVNAFVMDNPEIFWIENLFGYAYSDQDTIVEFYSVLSAQECEAKIRQLSQKVTDILSTVDENMTEYQKEKQIHDALLRNCTYKTGVSSSADGWQYFTVYGALAEGEAVCEGYAKAMQMLLSASGIPCGMIRGDAEGVAHIWNVIELGGEWYHTDPTWDDNDSEGNISYEYFNLTTEAITKNHTICDDVQTLLSQQKSTEIDPLVKYNFYVPICTKKDMNYYYVEGVMVEKCDGSADEQLIQAIIDKAKRHETYIPVRFGSSMTFTDYVNKLFYEAPYEFYYCLETANEKLSDKDKLDLGSVSILKNEQNMTIRVRIQYKPAATS